MKDTDRCARCGDRLALHVKVLVHEQPGVVALVCRTSLFATAEEATERLVERR